MSRCTLPQGPNNFSTCRLRAAGAARRRNRGWSSPQPVAVERSVIAIALQLPLPFTGAWLPPRAGVAPPPPAPSSRGRPARPRGGVPGGTRGVLRMVSRWPGAARGRTSRCASGRTAVADTKDAGRGGGCQYQVLKRKLESGAGGTAGIRTGPPAPVECGFCNADRRARARPRPEGAVDALRPVSKTTPQRLRRGSRPLVGPVRRVSWRSWGRPCLPTR